MQKTEEQKPGMDEQGKSWWSVTIQRLTI